MSELLEHIQVETGSGNPTYAVIWLHGLGADGHDFEPIVPELKLPADRPTRFVFPHAPMRPVTINNGYVMRAWFDIRGITPDTPQDEPGIRDAERLIKALIEREKERGVAAKNIFLAGFSQGGAMALHTGLRYEESLGGILCLSGMLALHEKLESERHPANHGIPIFIAHGLYDPMLPMALGTLTRDFLKNLGYQPIWHEYPMPHSVCPEEITHISQWLQTQMKS